MLYYSTTTCVWTAASAFGFYMLYVHCSCGSTAPWKNEAKKTKNFSHIILNEKANKIWFSAAAMPMNIIHLNINPVDSRAIACAHSDFSCVFRLALTSSAHVHSLFGHTICFMCVSVRFITPKFNIMSSWTWCRICILFFSRFFVRILMFCSRGIFVFWQTLQTHNSIDDWHRSWRPARQEESIHIVCVAPRLVAVHFLFRANAGRAIELQLSQFELIFVFLSPSLSRLLQSPVSVKRTENILQ